MLMGLLVAWRRWRMIRREQSESWTIRSASIHVTDNILSRDVAILECTLVVDGGRERAVKRLIRESLREAIPNNSWEASRCDAFAWLIKVHARKNDDAKSLMDSLKSVPDLLANRTVRGYASRRQLREYTAREVVVKVKTSILGSVAAGGFLNIAEITVVRGQLSPDRIEQLRAHRFDVEEWSDRVVVTVSLRRRGHFGHELRHVGNILGVRFDLGDRVTGEIIKYLHIS